MFNTTCQRCGKKNQALIMSIFNTQMICLDCQDLEAKHPLYETARKAEREAIQSGNRFFSGIGRPSDL